MASALSSVGGPPPAPNPTPQTTNPSPFAAAATPFAPGPGGAAGGAPEQTPVYLTHGQTVASLRHFAAIERETTKLLKSPECGRADMKSAIIDGMTNLVARRITTVSVAHDMSGLGSTRSVR
jgi:hypothetical protein